MPAQNNYSNLYLPIAIVLAGALVGLGLFLGLRGGTLGQQADGNGATAAVNIKDVKITAEDPYIGNANAPVTMAYWSDYQCPYCKAVEVGGVPQIPLTPAIPTLIKNYVDTGKLRIVFKDYPFLGQDSVTGALYEHAIWKLYPSQFYAWREAMYKAQDEEGDQGFGNAASIDQMIKTKFKQMDDAKIKADIAANTQKYTDEMNADRDEGAKFGIQGTPGFIIGKTLIPGAVELASFTQAIDPLLK